MTKLDYEGVKVLLEAVGEVVKEGCGLMWDGVCLAVAMPQSVTPSLEVSGEEWEGVCQEYGFEFVDFEAKGRNEYSGTSFSSLRHASRLDVDYGRTNGRGEAEGGPGSQRLGR